MNIDLDGIVVIVGNYGSGKTETAINLAVNRCMAGMDVGLADLDLVNPYFRSREARRPLEALGIEMVVPGEPYLKADLPVLSPAVAGLIRQPERLAILDAGGDDAGAAVLASLAGHLKGRRLHVLQVINPFRPSTDSLAGCHRIQAKIEAASRLTVNGLIGNANLVDLTTLDDFYNGYAFISELSRESGLPIQFVTAVSAMVPAIDTGRVQCPILSINRQLVPPWQKAAALGADGSFTMPPLRNKNRSLRRAEK